MEEKIEANEQHTAHLYHKSFIIRNQILSYSEPACLKRNSFNKLSFSFPSLFCIRYLSRALTLFISTIIPQLNPLTRYLFPIIPIICSFPFVVLCYRILPLWYIIHPYMTCLFPLRFASVTVVHGRKIGIIF